MSEINFKVRTMKKEDVPQALDVWRETGFHGGTHLLYTWLTVDPESMNVAVTDEGEIIGVCAASIHHDDLAVVGLYCVRKKYRGFGVGTKVWNACMDHIGSRNACLNAVPGKMELYRDKVAFPIVETDWVSWVYKTYSAVHPENLLDDLPSEVDIQPLEDIYLPLVYEYDRKLIGYDRELMLNLSFKEQDSRTFVAVKNGTCVGFGTIKISCQGPGQVGPLYADEKETAEAILKKLMLSFPQVKGFVMVTVSKNDPANELMKRIGCPPPESDIRIYRKKKVNVDLCKVYAQWDLNFSPY